MNRVQLRLSLICALELQANAPELMESACLDCGSRLDMHQPDADAPALFLGSCGECGRWYRVEVDVDEGRIWFLAVPKRDEVDPGDAPAAPG